MCEFVFVILVTSLARYMVEGQFSKETVVLHWWESITG